MQLSVNLTAGILIAMVMVFAVSLAIMTYCVLIKIEKESEEPYYHVSNKSDLGSDNSQLRGGSSTLHLCLSTNEFVI